MHECESSPYRSRTRLNGIGDHLWDELGAAEDILDVDVYRHVLDPLVDRLAEDLVSGGDEVLRHVIGGARWVAGDAYQRDRARYA